MDALRAFILILHAKVARDGLPSRYAIDKAKPMTPKLSAIKQQLGLLQNDVDTESQNLLNQIEAARTRTKTVFAGTRDKINQAMQGVSDQVSEIHEFLDGLQETNGGPTLADSSPSSGEPAASWSGNKTAS